ncbi:hypothetical protein DIPPA_64897 [Diplonema papillatum]|nr:hypothetical protein DIPPA_64897 [Diplonema papillatum]
MLAKELALLLYAASAWGQFTPAPVTPTVTLTSTETRPLTDTVSLTLTGTITESLTETATSSVSATFTESLTATESLTSTESLPVTPTETKSLSATLSESASISATVFLCSEQDENACTAAPGCEIRLGQNGGLDTCVSNCAALDRNACTASNQYCGFDTSGQNAPGRECAPTCSAVGAAQGVPGCQGTRGCMIQNQNCIQSCEALGEAACTSNAFSAFCDWRDEDADPPCITKCKDLGTTAATCALYFDCVFDATGGCAPINVFEPDDDDCIGWGIPCWIEIVIIVVGALCLCAICFLLLNSLRSTNTRDTAATATAHERDHTDFSHYKDYPPSPPVTGGYQKHAPSELSAGYPRQDPALLHPAQPPTRISHPISRTSWTPGVMRSPDGVIPELYATLPQAGDQDRDVSPKRPVVGRNLRNLDERTEASDSISWGNHPSFLQSRGVAPYYNPVDTGLVPGGGYAPSPYSSGQPMMYQHDFPPPSNVGSSPSQPRIQTVQQTEDGSVTSIFMVI